MLDWPISGLTVAAPGPAGSTRRQGALGTKQSKAAATLSYAVADAQHWAERFGVDTTEVLVNPSTSEFWNIIHELCMRLKDEWSDGAWGAEFKFFFSGHGTRQGEIVLSDGEVSVVEIVTRIGESVPRHATSRVKVGLALDSCFAGAALIDAMCELPPTVSLRDALASSLHDEESYEYEELGHGLFTYVMKHAHDIDEFSHRLLEVLTRYGWTIEGDRLVPPFELPADSPLLQPGLAIVERLKNTLVDLRALPYLSDGDQHALDIMNSHLITVSGRGEIDVSVDELTSAEDISEQIEALCRRNPLDLGVSFPGFPAS